jgi:hypothetical protein
VVIRACLQALLSIAGHGIGVMAMIGKSCNRGSDLMTRVASMPSITGILHVT